MRKILLVPLLALSLAACDFPRGAPMRSEIIAQAPAGTPSFDVVEVTRETLAIVEDWPATGWAGHYTWLEAGGGARSQILRPGDRVDLVIWDSDPSSLLTSATSKSAPMANLDVSPAGSVFIPYVGDVVVNGLTPDQARREIQTRLEKIAPSAQVQLSARAGLSNTADLVRGVANPGPVELPSRDFTILSLIAQGGGISPSLRNPLVRLIRGGQTFEIRADELLSDARRNIVIRGGDKVIVDEDKRYFIAFGATRSETQVFFERDRISALDAISQIGGLNDTRADPNGVLILREYPQSAVRPDGVKGPEMAQVVFSLDLTSADGLFAARGFTVQPGDVVIATESPLVGLNNLIDLVASGLLVRARL